MNKLTLKKEKGFYRIPLLEKLGVRALFTSRLYDMGFDGRARKTAYPKLGIHWKDLVNISQVHGDKIVKAGRCHRGKGLFDRLSAVQDTDALLTDVVGLPISILTADCLPVFLFDPKKRVGALVHAGWRGVHREIIPKMLGEMKNFFGAEAEDIVAVFGPAIGSCCYEVGREFLGHFPGNLEQRNGKFYFSLARTACEQLKRSKVKSRNIHDAGICTSCFNREFFSYRSEGPAAGRSMSILEIVS